MTLKYVVVWICMNRYGCMACSYGLLSLTAVNHAAFTAHVLLYVTVWGFSLSLVRKVLTLTRALYLHTEQAYESKGCLVRVARQARLFQRVKKEVGCLWLQMLFSSMFAGACLMYPGQFYKRVPAQ